MERWWFHGKNNLCAAFIRLFSNLSDNVIFGNNWENLLHCYYALNETDIAMYNASNEHKNMNEWSILASFQVLTYIGIFFTKVLKIWLCIAHSVYPFSRLNVDDKKAKWRPLTYWQKLLVLSFHCILAYVVHKGIKVVHICSYVCRCDIDF